MSASDTGSRWEVRQSQELYQVDAWGGGYFRINEQGHLEVRPDRGARSCDLFGLVEKLRQRGLTPPILLRFDQIVQDRVAEIQNAFNQAIEESGFRGRYHLAYPIKVNQQFQVVEAVRTAGRYSPLALEVGSKPELLAVMAIHDIENALLICNGYKDSEYIELAILAKKLGRRPIIVIEQPHEVDLVLRISEELETALEVGIRMKPSTKGAGRWDESATQQAKFGLSSWEVLEVAERLATAGKRDWLKLLHLHVGSQVTSIGAVTRVLREATRVYTEVAKLCPALSFFDAGGGLGVDYDGSRTSSHWSLNYSISEYAQEVVYGIFERCEETGVPHPDIITESGRATVAHHAMLIVEATEMSAARVPLPDDDAVGHNHELVRYLKELHDELSLKNCRETLHEALVMRDEMLEQFIRGDMRLVERASAERYLRAIVARIRELAVGMSRPLEELPQLEKELVTLCFCNFSIFQSIPDAWALNQLFPVMPIERLGEEPTEQAILADLTCDSDGQLNRFVGSPGLERSIRLHPVPPDAPYHIGIFLVGAYQEILGDLHNLFGDTNAVHVSLDDDGNTQIHEIVRGDTMQEVLEYVQFSAAELFDRLHRATDTAMRSGRMSAREVRKLEGRYREAMSSYTYLIRDDGAPDDLRPEAAG
jgi:arginine decarboxylase